MSVGVAGAAFLGNIAIDYVHSHETWWPAIFGILFLNDILSLPVNIFYLSSLDGETDFSNKWVQTVSFGSPIVSALIFAIGTLALPILLFLNGWGNEYLVAFLFLGGFAFLPHLLQLVPSILFAIYAKDMHASI